MKRKQTAFLLIILFLIAACEKEPTRVDDFLVDFATVVKPARGIAFQIGNAAPLIPEQAPDYSGDEGQRVLLNYTLLDKGSIRVNSVSDIFTGKVIETNRINALSRDPVMIQSVWVDGYYLNLILDIQFFEQKHTIGLHRDTRSSEVSLYFSHDSNNDPPGYASKLYASFLLADIRSDDDSPTPFRLHITSTTGQRVFDLEVE